MYVILSVLSLRQFRVGKLLLFFKENYSCQTTAARVASSSHVNSAFRKIFLIKMLLMNVSHFLIVLSLRQFVVGKLNF